MNFLVLSLIIYGVAATPVSITNNNQKIIGGSDAHAGQFPYQALIRHVSHLRILCGGSIISKEWILTSAVCSNLLIQPNEMRIVVGSIYLNNGGTTYTVFTAIKHPEYEEIEGGKNIGLIQVNGQISYNDFVQPIQLFGGSNSVGLPLTIAGWGVADTSSEVLPNTLQYTTLTSISLDECKKLITLPVPLFDMQLCTYFENREGLCSFDNGSPLVHNGQQHAVVSQTLYCPLSFPDIHIRVEPFRSWIKSVTNV